MKINPASPDSGRTADISGSGKNYETRQTPQAQKNQQTTSGGLGSIQDSIENAKQPGNLSQLFGVEPQESPRGIIQPADSPKGLIDPEDRTSSRANLEKGIKLTAGQFSFNEKGHLVIRDQEIANLLKNQIQAKPQSPEKNIWFNSSAGQSELTGKVRENQAELLDVFVDNPQPDSGEPIRPSQLGQSISRDSLRINEQGAVEIAVDGLADKLGSAASADEIRIRAGRKNG